MQSGQDLLTASEALSILLVDAGFRSIFAYPGTSELALCDTALAAGLRVINSRGDREAVFLAAGASKVRPRTSAALLHGARGLTNALGAIADCRRNEVSVLCIIGMASTSSAAYLPPHAEKDLIASAAPFAKSAYDSSQLGDADADVFIATVLAAFDEVQSTVAGPVLLGVPQDYLTNAFIPKRLLSSKESTARTGDPIDLQPAIEALQNSERPLIIVDDFLMTDGPQAASLLGDFAAKLGAPVTQVAYRRGPMLFQQVSREQVDSFIGPLDPENESHQSLVEDADLIITIEDRNMYPRVVGSLGNSAKLAITTNPEATSKNGYLTDRDLMIIGHAGLILSALSESVEQRRPWRALPKRQTLDGRNASIAGLRLVEALADGLSDVAPPVLVDDSQMFGGLVAMHYDVLPKGVRILGSHGGFVGSGMAVAAGISSANKASPTICLAGDQGFTNCIQALGVVGQEKLPLVVLVCNNGRSVSLEKQSQADGLSGRVAAFLGNNQAMSYSAVAEGYGVATRVVDLRGHGRPFDGSQLAWALKAALVDVAGGKGPQLIELIVEDASLWAGVWRTAGFEHNRKMETGELICPAVER